FGVPPGLVGLGFGFEELGVGFVAVVVVQGGEGRDGGLFRGGPEGRVEVGLGQAVVIVVVALLLPVLLLLCGEEPVGVSLIAGFGGRGIPGRCGQLVITKLLGVGHALRVRAAAGVFGLVELLELRVFEGRGFIQNGLSDGNLVVL